MIIMHGFWISQLRALCSVNPLKGPWWIFFNIYPPLILLIVVLIVTLTPPSFHNSRFGKRNKGRIIAVSLITYFYSFWVFMMTVVRIVCYKYNLSNT